MLEALVLQEIMELNTEMSSMIITPETSTFNHNLVIEEPYAVQDGNELKEIDENGKIKPRRSLRKRFRPRDNRTGDAKDSTKIQKMSDNESEVEKYYLSKKVKRLPSTLETIFEEPKQQNDKMISVSSRKFKRTIQFDDDLATATRLKLRKRQLKAKKLPSSKSFLNRKKISMDTLLKKLSGVESDKE